MNTTSRAILLPVLSTDTSLSISESQAIQSLISGRVPAVTLRNEHPGRLLVTQKAAAALLSVSRVTIWRLKRYRLIRSVEVLPRHLAIFIRGNRLDRARKADFSR